MLLVHRSSGIDLANLDIRGPLRGVEQSNLIQGETWCADAVYTPQRTASHSITKGTKRYKVMPNKRNTTTGPGEALIYEIRLKGHLGGDWTEWFGGLTLTLDDNGDTLLTGPVVDQAALHGLLRQVRDLGMPLVSVTPVEPGQAGAPDVRQ